MRGEIEKGGGDASAIYASCDRQIEENDSGVRPRRTAPRVIACRCGSANQKEIRAPNLNCRPGSKLLATRGDPTAETLFPAESRCTL